MRGIAIYPFFILIFVITLKLIIMGDYAEMTLDGTLDFFTGEYIGEGTGYPRTHNYNKETSQSAKVRGIEKYIRKYLGKEVILHEVVNNYVEDRGIKINVKSWRGIATHISGHCFHDFGNYLRELKTKNL